MRNSKNTNTKEVFPGVSLRRDSLYRRAYLREVAGSLEQGLSWVTKQVQHESGVFWWTALKERLDAQWVSEIERLHALLVDLLDAACEECGCKSPGELEDLLIELARKEAVA